jgi:hypothetical protein
MSSIPWRSPAKSEAKYFIRLLPLLQINWYN